MPKSTLFFKKGSLLDRKITLQRQELLALAPDHQKSLQEIFAYLYQMCCHEKDFSLINIFLTAFKRLNLAHRIEMLQDIARDKNTLVKLLHKENHRVTRCSSY